MNPLSDSLMTPLTVAPSRGASPLVLGDGVNADGPGGRDPGAAGGFAAVLGRVQDGRAGDEPVAATDSQVTASTGSGAQGEALADVASADVAPADAAPADAAAAQTGVLAADAQVGAEGAGRQGMAAAFAAQWAALLTGGEGAARPSDPETAKHDVSDSPGEAQGAAMGDSAGAVGDTADLAVKGLKGLYLGERLQSLGAWTTKAQDDAGQASSPKDSEGDSEGAEATPTLVPGAVDGTAVAAPLLPVPPVVALQISPQLSVITAGQPTASDESLRAYAAAQGFDAAALQRMFGAAPAAPAATTSPATPAVSAVSVSPAGGGAVAPALAAGATAWWAAQMTSSTPGASQVTVAPNLAAPETVAGLAAIGGSRPAGQDSAAPAGLAQGLAGSVLMPALGVKNQSSVSNSYSTASKVPDSLAESLGRFSADGGRFATTRSDAGAASGDAVRPFGGLGLTSGSGMGIGAAAGSGASSVTMAAATSAWWALQAREGFSPIAGANPVSGAAAGAVESVDGASALAVGDAAPASSSAMAGVVEQAAPTHKTQAAAVARPVDAHPIDLRDHLEQSHEALSKRLGEALAARMIAQIEKGDWQIRLSVAPAHLGPIDIDLQMRGQRMDAQFQVAHGQTQALIQDGLPRLREAVGASGMDLASVWVSGGWNERNRGNPTPGQPNDPALLSLNEGGGDEPEVSGAPSVDSRGPGKVPRPGGVDILI